MAATKLKNLHGRNRRTSKAMILAEQRKLEALRLASRGMTMREIGERLGVTPQAAHLSLKNALESLADETRGEAERYRELERLRLETCLQGIYEQATNGDLFAIDRVIKISDRLARLYGLNAPTRIAPTDPTGQHAYDPPANDTERAERILAELNRRRAMEI